MGAQLTQEEVLRRAYEVHGDRWVYDKFEYKQMLSKVTIGCKVHGYFEQTPAKHIHQKQGCPKCGRAQAGYSKQMTHSRGRLEGIEQPHEYKIIPLTPTGEAKVSNEDFDSLRTMSWKNSDGYAVSTKYGAMHRLIMDAPKHLFVDHINRDRMDNRRENLRLVTPRENTYNSSPYGRSVYKGVSWNKIIGKWVVQIVFNGQSVCVKYFDDEVEAAKYYDKEIVKYHGDKAYLNFP